MDALTVKRFVTPAQYGQTLPILPGVFLTVSPRGRDVRAQISIRKPLDPALAVLLGATPGGYPLAELDGNT